MNESGDKNDEMLRPTINIKKDNNIWRIFAFIFIALFCISLAVIILLTIIIFKDEESESDEKEKKDEEEPWAPAGTRLKTKWGKNLNPEKVWQEYPRPQLVRNEWLNLNGMWSYSIRNAEGIKPEKHDGKILVPFSIESSLSGVMKTFTDTDILWYEKEFELKKEWENKHILLHFGAVDWKCEVFVNDYKIGEHIGGYAAFYFDITQRVKVGKNKIVLKVIDKTDRSYQPVGKQTLTPGSIWYTPISGIWQTVWLEPVNELYINKIEFTNDFDSRTINVKFNINSDIKLPINVTLLYNNKIIETTNGKSNEIISITIPEADFYPWSPSDPNLYEIKVQLFSEVGTQYDSINTYTTMRKVEKLQDSTGYYRIYLNNKPLFNMGTLDQGYWPDGLYTPPSEEAMVYDIQKLKDLGFNTIRKHIKVEPYRYYYHCDKMGMLLWQDMPAGDIAGSNWDPRTFDGGGDKQRTQESKDNYYREWGEIMDNLKFFQCIIVWVPFNEGWGQFDTEYTVDFTRQRDNSRLINAASGGNHRNCSHFLDIHPYPAPDQYLERDYLINVIGEYGGLGLVIKDHTWQNDSWGYYMVETREELTLRYQEYIEDLIKLIQSGGISAAIYTQTTDVEGEINGLITYDRAEVKIFENKTKENNEKIIKSLQE